MTDIPVHEAVSVNHPGRWLRRAVIPVIQILVSVAIVGYLAYQASHSGALTELARHEKRWGWLIVGGFCLAVGTSGTFFRWYRLLRSCGLMVSWRDTFRFSAVGFIANLAPLGMVGGDLLKAVLIARHQPQRRADAITSVLMDRVIGLAALFYVITLFAFLTGSVRWPGAEFRELWGQYRAGMLSAVPGEMLFQLLIWAALALTLIGTLAATLVIWPRYTGGRLLLGWIGRIPGVGPKLGVMLESFESFGRRPLVLLESVLLAMMFHALFGIGTWCFTHGLLAESFGPVPQLLMFSMANSSQVIPLPIGPLELVLDLLYRWVPSALGGAVTMKAGDGLIIAICYRMASAVFAVLLVPCWFLSRREVHEVRDEMARDEMAMDTTQDSSVTEPTG